MNTIIINAETAANQYRDLQLELLTHDLKYMSPLEVAKDITQLGNELQELLSPISSVAFSAFREQFRTGCTLCFVSQENGEKLEAWDHKNEDFQIAVFTNEGRPVGVYGKDVLSW